VFVPEMNVTNHIFIPRLLLTKSLLLSIVDPELVLVVSDYTYVSFILSK